MGRWGNVNIARRKPCEHPCYKCEKRCVGCKSNCDILKDYEEKDAMLRDTIYHNRIKAYLGYTRTDEAKKMYQPSKIVKM